jgi:hypothetical protein
MLFQKWTSINRQVVIKFRTNWFKQEVKCYCLWSTKSVILFGIRRNCLICVYYCTSSQKDWKTDCNNYCGTSLLWVRITPCLHTESSVRTHERLYTLAAPGSVQKAAVMDPRRAVTRRPRLAGCNEDSSRLTAMKTTETRNTAGLRWCGVGSVRPNSGARRSQSRWRWSVLCLPSDGGWHCTVLRALRATLFIPVGAARRRPLEGGVAAMLHIHSLGGRKPG